MQAVVHPCRGAAPCVRAWMWPDTASSDTPDSIQVCSSSRHTCTPSEPFAKLLASPSHPVRATQAAGYSQGTMPNQVFRTFLPGYPTPLWNNLDNLKSQLIRSTVSS